MRLFIGCPYCFTRNSANSARSAIRDETSKRGVHRRAKTEIKRQANYRNVAEKWPSGHLRELAVTLPKSLNMSYAPRWNRTNNPVIKSHRLLCLGVSEALPGNREMDSTARLTVSSSKCV